MEWDFCTNSNMPGVQEAALLPTADSFRLPKVYTAINISSSNAGYYLGHGLGTGADLGCMAHKLPSVSGCMKTIGVSNYEASQ